MPIVTGARCAAGGVLLCPARPAQQRSYPSASSPLQRLLPEGSEVPSSFEAVGDIAHMNLREELLPWKFVVGQVRRRGGGGGPA